jgi:protein phosphatase
MSAVPDFLQILTVVAAIGLVAWVVFALGGREDTADSGLKRDGVPPPRPSPTVEVTSTAAPKPVPAAATPATPPAAPSSASELVDDEPTGPNALILVTAVGRTDPGLKRSHNEDAYAILEDHKLFVIADGMGRHAAGEVASRLCVDAITETFRTKGSPSKSVDPPLPHRAARLRAAILEANRKVLAAAQETEGYHGMGTTVVAAYFSPNNQRVYVAHVGDSRCYRLRRGALVQLTMDHTLGAAGITGKSAALLSRAVGIEPNVDVDLLIEAPEPGDIYLLCSDGLSRMVSDEFIQGTVERIPNLDDATKTLIEKANEQGGRDNITAILVRVDAAL